MEVNIERDCELRIMNMEKTISKQQIKKIKQGIGGWLLFFTVTIFIYMFSALISIFDATIMYVSYFHSFDFYNKVSLLFSLLMVILFFILLILVFIQIVRKNVAGKYAAMLLCFFGIFMEIVNLIILSGIKPYVLIYIVIWAIIWITYFNKSKRVKNTLINESSGQWVKSVVSIGGILLTIGHIAGIIIHIYTAYLAFKLYGIMGLFIAIMLPGISEAFMFIKSIISSGTFYNLYSILLMFYLVVTYGIAIVLNYLGNKMTNEGVYIG